MAQKTRKKSTSGTGRKRNVSTGRNSSASGTAAKKRGASSARTSGRKNTAASAKRTTARKYYPEENASVRGDIMLIALGAFLLLLFLACFGLVGPAGDAVGSVLFGIFGSTAYVFPPVLFLLVFFTYLNRDAQGFASKLGAFILFYCCLGIFFAMISGYPEDGSYSLVDLYTHCSEEHTGGGVLFGSVSYFLRHYLKTVGEILLLMVSLLIGIVLISGNVLEGIFSREQEDIYEQEEDTLRKNSQDEENYEMLKEQARRSHELRIKERAIRREEENRIREENLMRRKAKLEEAKERRLREESDAVSDTGMKKKNSYSGSLEETTLYGDPSAVDMNGRPEDMPEAPVASSETDYLRTTATAAVVSARSTDELLRRKTEIQTPMAFSDAMPDSADLISDRTPIHEETNEHVDEAGEKTLSERHESYSVSRDLHEITVNDADYSSISLEKDIRDNGDNPAVPAYSGIGVPVPQDTNPDYASDDFSEKIYRQSVEEALHHEISTPAGKPSLYTAPAYPDVPDAENVTETGNSGEKEDADHKIPEEILLKVDERAPAEDHLSLSDAELQAAETESTEDSSAGKPASNAVEMHPAGDILPENIFAQDDPSSTEYSEEYAEERSEEPISARSAVSLRPEASTPEASISETSMPERSLPGSSVVQNSQLSENRRPDIASSPISAEQLNEVIVDRERAETEKTASAPAKAVAAVSAEKEEFVFPPLTLLSEGEHSKNPESDRELQETAVRLENTLKTFGVDVTIPQVSQGPAVTRYELLPAMGVKVSRIVSLADDIKLNLAAADIRIEAPIPGKQAIGIEVPNRVTSTVALRDLLSSEAFTEFKGKIPFAVGKDIGGNVVVADITKMPHMLIAGATGSGKSVCINTLIMSILYSRTPDEVKLILIDPKIVELSVYNGIPHLLLPVVTDPKKAASALQWATAEMNERYRKFAENSVRDLKGYNEKAKSGKDSSMEPLPQIVIIVDELADLMMVSAHEVEDAICRLAQLARAAGIHLIIATQRPSVDVITGLIKANMPSRIAFAVSSGVDSRTILDINGAEKLLGKGDMLFDPQNYPKPARVQGAYVSDEEIQDIVNYITYHNASYVSGPEIAGKIENMLSGEGTGVSADGSSGSGSDLDEHFVEAGYLLIDKQKASIGMLQRVYKIGFNRAARLMDDLAEAGVVSEDEGTKGRRVLMSRSDFESYIESNGL